MINHNDRAKALVKDYCSEKKPPGYALMIKGKWGCGKTHLINECIDELNTTNKEVKFLQISLYGVSSKEEIDTRIYEQLNPILTSKSVVIASKIGKALLRGTLKVDLDGDEKHDGSISPTIPDIDLGQLGDTKEKILVFDDLERSSMYLPDLLGYINYFVEKESNKVIIIADEDKIYRRNSESKEKDDLFNKYAIIKEKVIGWTIDVKANAESLFDVLLGEIEDTDTKKIIIDYRGSIVRLFNIAGHGNLRHLKRSFYELRKVARIIGHTDIYNKQDLVSSLIDTYFSFFFEISAGNLSPSDINSLIGEKRLIRKIKQEEALDKSLCDLDKIEKKYGLIDLDSAIVYDIWIPFFTHGIIDQNNAISSIKATHYFKENDENWKKIWYYEDLSINDFSSYLENLRSEIENKKFLELGIIKHVVGILISLSIDNLINESPEDIYNDMTSYLDSLNIENIVLTNEIESPRSDFNDSFDGHQFRAQNNEYYIKFKERVYEKVLEKNNNKLISESGTVIDLMEKPNVKSLYEVLGNKGAGKENNYYYEPILMHIDTDSFVKTFVNLSNKDKNIMTNILVSRHKNTGPNMGIYQERDWLNEIEERICIIHDSMKNNLDKAVLSKNISNIRKITKHLNGIHSNELK